jgi:hypothetical protein
MRGGVGGGRRDLDEIALVRGLLKGATSRSAGRFESLDEEGGRALEGRDP